MAVMLRKAGNTIQVLLSDLQDGRQTVEQVEEALQDIIKEKTNAHYQEGFMDGYDQGKKDCKQRFVNYLDRQVSRMTTVVR